MNTFIKYKIAEAAIENLFNSVIKEFSPSNDGIIKTIYVHKNKITLGEDFFQKGIVTKIVVLPEKKRFKDPEQYYSYIVDCDGVPVHSGVGIIESALTIIYE